MCYGLSLFCNHVILDVFFRKRHGRFQLPEHWRDAVQCPRYWQWCQRSSLRRRYKESWILVPRLYQRKYQRTLRTRRRPWSQLASLARIRSLEKDRDENKTCLVNEINGKSLNMYKSSISTLASLLLCVFPFKSFLLRKQKTVIASCDKVWRSVFF